MNKLLLYETTTRLLRRSLCTQPPTGSRPESMSANYRPSNLEKNILVWTKKYKTKEEIPKFVSAVLLEKARSQARIKIANILMLVTILASFGAVLSGKAAAKRGESVHQMNLDWHKKYEEDYEKKQETSAK